MMKNWNDILENAIQHVKPNKIICLYSGGYDSAIATHLAHGLIKNSSLLAYAIDTGLSADGWRKYVASVSDLYGWKLRIQKNTKGYNQYLEFVARHGNPYSRTGHTHAYRRLKERAIDAIHMKYKTKRSDRTLFVTGIRRAESRNRSIAPEWSRRGKSNVFFVSPILYWNDEDCANYRLNHSMPDNPFYNTVTGSGDCQCNWGRFIDRKTLRKHSPELERTAIAEIDRLSREAKGYGWGESPKDVKNDDNEYDTNLGLCQGCSRTRHKPRLTDIEKRILQEGI